MVNASNVEEVLIDGTFFTFPESWKTAVFDKWPQFDSATPIGLKGCDVIAIDGEELWLIEVKDYTYDGAKQPEGLHETVGLKAAGTMAILFAQSRSHSDSAAKLFSADCANVKRINLALHVEVKDGGRGEKQVKAALPPLKDRLKKISKALGLHKSYVTSTLAPSTGTPWTSRRDPSTRSLHQDR